MVVASSNSHQTGGDDLAAVWFCGFRSTASTVLNEHGFRSDVIERQLAHGERDKVRAAYNHAQYLSERREMMQWWADFLDGLAAGK
jgi:integrase